MTTIKTMKTTMKTLTAVALAAAALSVTVGASKADTLLPAHHLPVASGVQVFKHIPVPGETLSGPLHICHTCILGITHPPKPPKPPHGWGYGNHWPHGFGHGYGPVYGGAPVAPVAVAPVAPAAPVAVTPVAAAPVGECNCLTRQMLPNGAELLQDICTKQSAIAEPQVLGNK